ncbi:MAG: surface-adhesin E family protein [Limnohabitans sp.]
MTFTTSTLARVWVTAAIGMGCMTGAQAMNWTRIGETQEVTLYVNRNAIEKDDYIRRIWEMQDLKQPDGDGVMSRRYQNEYDCKHKMHRIVKMDSFSGPKLTGQQLFRLNEAGYWRKIPPNGLFVLPYIWLCVE